MAATGTPTPNIGLRRPQGTDPASVDDINYNSNLIDTKLGPVGNSSVQEQINSLNSNLENKAKYINLGVLSASGIKNVLSAVYDALPGNDIPCLIKFNASGWWVGFAYKYSNADYGVVSATRYNTQMYTLHVSKGVYTLVTYQTTSE